MSDPRVALITGVSRSEGIGAALADRLRKDGLTVVTSGWVPYDEEMPWGSDESPVIDLEVDLSDATACAELMPRAVAMAGPVAVLVMAHAHCHVTDIRTTTVESFDRHMVVNARASWQLIRAFAEQFAGPAGRGRIVALTSDHTAGNLPYGASKGALDRVVIAAAKELADIGVTANVVNPGATDTGWITEDIAEILTTRNLQPRFGIPSDAANLVSFLVSEEGGWINGQLLLSDGGLV